MSLLSILFFGFSCFNAILADIVPIVDENHDSVMQNSRLTFVAFTAEWCPFSRQLLPTFQQAAVDYKIKYPDRKTVWGNVDCVANENLCKKYSVNKYPTMKVFFYGYMMTEYRGGRQLNSLVEYVDKMENTAGLVNLEEAESMTQWQQHADPQKGTLVLWFPRNSPPFELILKAIALIHDRLTVVVPPESNLLEHEQHKLWFSMDGAKVEEFQGSVTNFKEIVEWVRQKSAGMVRELTFENIEAFVEERTPLLVLFRKKGDTDVEQKFVKAIRRELDEKALLGIHPLMADSDAMWNVVAQFGRTPDQGPFMFIDQFVHVYPSPWEGDEIFAEGNIKQFVADLFNDKHHINRHQQMNQIFQMIFSETQNVEKPKEIAVDSADPESEGKKMGSVLNKLQPSKNRYSFAKQEL